MSKYELQKLFKKSKKLLMTSFFRSRSWSRKNFAVSVLVSDESVSTTALQLNDMKSIFYSDSISLQSAEFAAPAYALFLLNVGTYDTHLLA